MGTQPENTHGIQTQTQPNPYPNFGSGSGITLGYPNFGYPIPAIVPGAEAAGFVSPSITLPVLTTFRPSQTMGTTGPEAM